MGGRGAASGYTTRLPNRQRAIITGSKIKNYILDPVKSNGKYKYFNELGYTVKNADRLVLDIRKGLRENKAHKYEKNKYGNRAYEVVMTLGMRKKGKILTAWQIDKGSNIPRFITAYKYEGK